MSQLLKFWEGNHLNQIIPWIRCLAVLVPVISLATFESTLLRKTKENNVSEERVVRDMEVSNQENEIQINNALAKNAELIKEADVILGGLLRPEQEEPNLTPLEQLGVTDSEEINEEAVLKVKVSSNKVEYHALVPALNQQETNAPLMRCTWLSLKATGRPFNTSALPLQVDLEMTFPRAVASHTATPEIPTRKPFQK